MLQCIYCNCTVQNLAAVYGCFPSHLSYTQCLFFYVCVAYLVSAVRLLVVVIRAGKCTGRAAGTTIIPHPSVPSLFLATFSKHCFVLSIFSQPWAPASVSALDYVDISYTYLQKNLSCLVGILKHLGQKSKKSFITFARAWRRISETTSHAGSGMLALNDPRNHGSQAVADSGSHEI